MKYFIANWKANFTYEQSVSWIQEFLDKIDGNGKMKENLQKNDIAIIICPPFPFIPYISDQIKGRQNIFAGSQDLSMYDTGKYTGETTASMLQKFITYSILGHSERRNYFHETNEMIQAKMDQARKYGITPIYCIRDANDFFPRETKIIAYEPVEAIGTGKNEEFSKVLEVKKALPLINKITFLYGGSVTAENQNQYLLSDEINGFLIGGASTDPHSFYHIINDYSHRIAT